MKLEKLHSGSSANRTASGAELLNRYVFGDSFPTKFISGNLYMSGQYVYQINPDGTISIYQCQTSGTYDSIDTIHWSPANIDVTIRDYIYQLLGINTNSKYTVEMSYDTYVSGELAVSGRRITLPEKVEPYSNFMLFLDGKYVSSDLGEYEITIKNHIKYIETDRAFESFLLYVATPLNHNAKLIAPMDIRPSSVSKQDGNVVIYIPSEVTRYGSYSFNVYIDGAYVASNAYDVEYNDSTDNLILTMKDLDDVTTDVTKYIIAVITSRSEYISLQGSKITLPIRSDVERYRLELPDGFGYYHCPIVFCNDKAIPATVVHIEDGIMSISDEAYYGVLGDSYTVMSFNFVVSGDADITNGSIVVDMNERKIPIPIINYDEYATDIMVFRKQGSIINRNRYYTSDGYMCLYPHEESVTDGDIVNFHIFNNDSYMVIGSKISEVRVDKTVSLPEILLDKQFLLFATNGTYIGKNNYGIEDGVLVFHNDASVEQGDMVEFIYCNYTAAYTNTINKVVSTIVAIENQITLPLKTYNRATDSLMVFNCNTGLYIDNENYQVMANGVINITSGSGVDVGDHVDIYVLRKFNKLIYVSSIPYIIDTI